MSGGGVENHWRLGGGMDLIIRFYLSIFFSPCMLVMVRYKFKVLIGLFASGHRQF